MILTNLMEDIGLQINETILSSKQLNKTGRATPVVSIPTSDYAAMLL